MTMTTDRSKVSISPDGEVFTIPPQSEYTPELQGLKSLADTALAEVRGLGRGHVNRIKRA